MHAHQAYRQHRQSALTRVDAILTLYRLALDRLDRAAAAIDQARPDAARPLLTETQLIVSSLSAGYAGSQEPSAANFLRLYEFVAHQLTLGTAAALTDARKIMATMMEGFDAVRDQAATMEAQGQIPPLDRDGLVHLTA